MPPHSTSTPVTLPGTPLSPDGGLGLGSVAPLPRERRGGFDFTRAILLVVVAFLVYQVVVPLAFLLWGSLKSSRPTDADYLTLNLTLQNYVDALGGTEFWQAMGNTVVYAFGSTILSAVLGVALAIIVARTDAPFRGMISTLTYVRIIIPGLLTAIAWVFLGSPTIGILNGLYKTLFDATEPLFNVYSMTGMIIVQGLDTFPLVYLTVVAALKSMDPALEEAAFTAGKPLIYTFRRITLPMIQPAIVASSILVFIHNIESFEVPLVLGLPVKIFVLSTEIFFKTTYVPTDYGAAGAYGVLLLGIALSGVYLYQHLTRRAYAFVTVSGKAFRPRIIPLGRWRWVVGGLSLVVIFIAVILPTLVLLWASFQRFFQQPSLRALKTASWANYELVLGNGTVMEGIKNSLLLGFGSATVLVLIVSISSWMVYRTRIPGRKTLDFLAFVPQAVPSVLFGVAMLWLYLVVPIPVYGTLWIILLAYITRYLPHAMRIISVGMLQFHPELEEAGYACGASWWRMFRRILLPLLRPVLVTAWIWVMIHAFRELPVSAILSGPETKTVGVAIYSLWTEGSFGLISAFSIMIITLLIVVSYAAEMIGRRFGVTDAR
jgi:iron(III) transport system permease protein